MEYVVRLCKLCMLATYFVDADPVETPRPRACQRLWGDVDELWISLDVRSAVLGLLGAYALAMR